jgi:hypothetical protein
MNYTLFAEYIKDVERELMTRFGVPAHAAADIAQYAELTGIAEEAKAKNESQYEMNYRKYGSVAMAERYEITPQAARKRFHKMIQKKIPMVAVSVAA